MGGSRPADGDDYLGAVLGERYRIVSCLSKGGMGVIYRAQHTVLDKPMAIKIMLQPQDEAARQRFLQEAKLASLVRHPNIVDIVDFGVLSSQQPYLVMELLVGQTLADAIYQGPISPVRTCYIAAQVARGLFAVHQKGIIHRDLKPANIFIIKQPNLPGQASSDGQTQGELVKVVDFGIATVVDNAEGPPGSGPPARLTTPGMVLGTAEYMSPEQAQGLKTDHRVDQYALGCIMYEMLTGRIPFQGVTPAATMLKHLTEKPKMPSEIRPGLPPALEAIVLRAMSREPADRFPSMEVLEKELVKLFEKLRSRSVSSSTLALPKLQRPTNTQRRQLMLGAGLGLSVVLLGTLIYTLRKPTPPVVKPKAVVEAPKGPLTVNWFVTSKPSGASVVRLSDNKVLGETPYRRELPTGEGTTAVELRLEGFQPATLQLSNSADDSPKKVHLQPLSPTKGGSSVKGGQKKGKGKKKGPIRDNNDLDMVK